jgi:hypothetical protein
MPGDLNIRFPSLIQTRFPSISISNSPRIYQIFPRDIKSLEHGNPSLTFIIPDVRRSKHICAANLVTSTLPPHPSLSLSSNSSSPNQAEASEPFILFSLSAISHDCRVRTRAREAPQIYHYQARFAKNRDFRSITCNSLDDS